MTDSERRLSIMTARALADLYERMSKADSDNKTLRIVLDLRNLAHIVEAEGLNS